MGEPQTPQALPCKFALRKAERLTSRSRIQEIFEGGTTAKQSGLRFKYVLEPRQQAWPYPAKVLFGVAKRRFRKAHDRNHIRRHLREAYRHEKAPLYEALEAAGLQLSLAVGYERRELGPPEDLRRAFRKGLAQIVAQFTGESPPASRPTEAPA